MSLVDEFKMFILIPACAGVGIAIAMILEVFYNRGLIIDEYIAGSLTLANIQSVVVIFFILIGVLLAVKIKR